MRLKLAVFIAFMMGKFTKFTAPPCNKTELGYTCHHRKFINGKRECD